MFEYIKGNLVAFDPDAIVLDHQGIGFRIFVSSGVLSNLPGMNREMMVRIHPVYKEDDLILYGFADVQERKLFRTLIGVSGIGPKAAMSLLSCFDHDALIRAIVREDAKALSKAPGIGKKTAERVVLELKDKFKDVVLAGLEDVSDGGAVEHLRQTDQLWNDAVNGLMGLGWSYIEASECVDQVLKPGMTLEEVLHGALLMA